MDIPDIDLDRLPGVIQGLFDANPDREHLIEIAARSPGVDLTIVDDQWREVTITDDAGDGRTHLVGRFLVWDLVTPEWLMAAPKDPERTAKTNIGELVTPAVLAHPLPERQRIIELIEAGRFELRRMLPSPNTDPNTFTLDDARVQAYVTEEDGTVIPITDFPVSMLGRVVEIPDDIEGIEDLDT